MLLNYLKSRDPKTDAKHKSQLGQASYEYIIMVVIGVSAVLMLKSCFNIQKHSDGEYYLHHPAAFGNGR